MKKSFSALASAVALLGAFTTPAIAASTFHLVVPLTRSGAPGPVDPVMVSLTGAELPRAILAKSYSQSLSSYVSVTGDPGYDSNRVSWSITDGNLPEGLTFDSATGSIGGTPSASTTAPELFTVQATYKDKAGSAIYKIQVGADVLYVKHFTLGHAHACAVTEDNLVKCWGLNGNTQVGPNAASPQLTPTVINGLGGVPVKFALGSGFSCALLSDSVKCWGSNFGGTLGDGTTRDHSAPVKVIGLDNLKILDLVSGNSFSCVLLDGGSVKCWGRNSYGQLGDGTLIDKSAPTPVLGLSSEVKAIFANGSHSCAQLADGTLKCWGYNSEGQLGIGNTTNQATPVQPLIGKVKSFAAGYVHSCAILVDGSVSCWGRNNEGQLGNNSTASSKAPVSISITDVQYISAGNNYTCAMHNSGSVSCWGLNTSGQLGTGDFNNRAVPTSVQNLEQSTQLLKTAGLNACVLLSSGSLKCWGGNSAGQLGNGLTTNSAIPVVVQKGS